MKFIWIRHGQTDLNAAGRYLGHYDAVLNEKGRLQAKEAAEKMRNECIHHFYASDLQRCMETARIIGEPHGLVPLPVPALRELNFGDWEGKTYDEVMEMDAPRLTAWYNTPDQISPPGGEWLQQLGQRLDDWLRRVMHHMKEDETAVIVSHGGPVRWFEANWLIGKPGAFWEVAGIRHGERLVAQWDGYRWKADRL